MGQYFWNFYEYNNVVVNFCYKTFDQVSFCFGDMEEPNGDSRSSSPDGEIGSVGIVSVSTENEEHHSKLNLVLFAIHYAFY